MTGVANYRQLRYSTTKLYRNLPHWGVTVNLLLVARETTMNGSKTLNTSLVYALQCSNPQLQVGVNWVLYKHRYIYPLQRVGNSLHGKWVGRCTCSNPQNVDAVLQCQFNMLWCSHLGRYQHLCFFLNLLKPYQCRLSVTFKATGLGTWFPYTSTEIVATFHCQFLGGSQHLFLSLRRARSCNHKGTFIVTW